jgi:hypothetical protein
MTKDKAKKLIVPPALQFTPTRLRHTTKGERMIEEDDDTQVYKKPWVNLTDTQIQNIYFKVVDEHRGVPTPHGQVLFGQAVQARLKELNT